ncbi:cytochrome c peroxidase [Terrimonas pollutisoli]|uniref:cytochrome c peroxidase n=1 Tax=Terrimonas pollutisoli TaxID=3034147 RepID=UPI0023EAEBB7|nr:cytochrome c peroxidase [Terrimonas sp. H1YJ31]
MVSSIRPLKHKKYTLVKKTWVIAISCLACLIWAACFNSKKETTAQQVVAAYQSDIEGLLKQVDTLIAVTKKNTVITDLQQQFYKAKYAYKQIEWLAEYYQPYTARFINGPALQEVEPENKAITIEPEGFQVIEEYLFPAYDSSSKKELVQQIALLRSNISRLQKAALNLETTDAHIFDALRLQLFRIIALGISGFDSPIAQNSIKEAAASIKGIQFYLSSYLQKNKTSQTIDSLLQATQKYLAAQHDFIALDRMQLITRYLDPLAENILALQNELHIPVFSEPRLLKAGARHLFAAGIFNPDFYIPDAASASSAEKIALGEKLFYDPVLSANRSRSCASCHQPDKAFTDRLKANKALNGLASLQRNTPTLLNAALQPALFYDIRVNYLEDQAKAVITNKGEMHGSLAAAVKFLKEDGDYQQLFKKAYQGEEMNELHIKNAIAAYVRSLIALNSRFDQYMQGNKMAMNQVEIDGFNLFMGKGKCGTCHFVPLFNGNNPPQFLKVDAEIIGVPTTSDTLHPRLDADQGKYYNHKIDLYRFAFKTPTLRNIELTAPYMHNGVFNTLEEVIAFYDRGGGKGLGLRLDNQTLPEEQLKLSAYEKKALVAFLKTLNDTVITRHHK